MNEQELRRIFTGLYRDGGRGEIDMATGCPLFDCWGVVMAAHRCYGIILPDFVTPAEDAVGVNATYQEQVTAQAGHWLVLPEPAAPCVVVMAVCPDSPRACNHFGTYIGDGAFVHILSRQRVHVSRVNEIPWVRRIKEFRKWAA